MDIDSFGTNHFILDVRYVADPMGPDKRWRPYAAVQFGYVPGIEADGTADYGDAFAGVGFPGTVEDITLNGDEFFTLGGLVGASYLLRDGLSLDLSAFYEVALDPTEDTLVLNPCRATCRSWVRKAPTTVRSKSAAVPVGRPLLVLLGNLSVLSGARAQRGPTLFPASSGVSSAAPFPGAEDASRCFPVPRISHFPRFPGTFRVIPTIRRFHGQDRIDRPRLARCLACLRVASRRTTLLGAEPSKSDRAGPRPRHCTRTGASRTRSTTL
ncbi:MAG: hypothetical protein R3E96_01735 [Planctomycetota bacterium]